MSVITINGTHYTHGISETKDGRVFWVESNGRRVSTRFDGSLNIVTTIGHVVHKSAGPVLNASVSFRETIPADLIEQLTVLRGFIELRCQENARKWQEENKP